MLARIPLILTVLAVLAFAGPLAPGASGAMKSAKFNVTFEAQRTVDWKIPRHAWLTDCKGRHWKEAQGSEDWKMKTRKPVKLLVTGGFKGSPGMWMWNTHSRARFDPRAFGLEAAGWLKRDYSEHAGNTGGWCGGADVADPRPNDCGTRLPTYVISLATLGRKVTWSHAMAEHSRAAGKLGFDDCGMHPPEDFGLSTFPALPAERFRASDLFNRRKKTVTLKASKSWPTEEQPLTNGYVIHTSGTAKWKMVLRRVK
jgi:hypothetical protein